MKIAIDCRMYNSSGIGTYLQGILPFLLEYKEYDFLLIGDKEKLDFFLCDGVEILDCSIPFFSLGELINFPVDKINKCDIFFTPNYNIPFFIKIPIYSYIHDVVFLDLKKLTSKFGLLIRRFYAQRAIRISKSIFTVSKFSKSRINAHFNTQKKIIVNYCAVKQDLISFDNSADTTPNEEYILFVGNIKKHKGLKTLLKGLDYAFTKGFNKKLYIIGEKEGFKTKGDDFNFAERDDIVFLGKISDNQLYNYMQNAFVLVQPSEYEGFGLPPLESLYLGTGCLMSDIPVFKEIYNDFENCFFFKTGDPESLGEKLLSIKPIKIEQKEKIEKKFSFKISASLIIDEIRKN